jgi:hypothetical protein
MAQYNFTEHAKVGKWAVMVDPDSNYGYFEPESGIEGGGLWFDGKELMDFDGRYELPADVAAALEQLGYIVGEDFKP